MKLADLVIQANEICKLSNLKNNIFANLQLIKTESELLVGILDLEKNKSTLDNLSRNLLEILALAAHEHREEDDFRIDVVGITPLYEMGMKFLPRVKSKGWLWSSEIVKPEIEAAYLKFKNAVQHYMNHLALGGESALTEEEEGIQAKTNAVVQKSQEVVVQAETKVAAIQKAQDIAEPGAAVQEGQEDIAEPGAAIKEVSEAAAQSAPAEKKLHLPENSKIKELIELESQFETNYQALTATPNTKEIHAKLSGIFARILTANTEEKSVEMPNTDFQDRLKKQIASYFKLPNQNAILYKKINAKSAAFFLSRASLSEMNFHFSAQKIVDVLSSGKLKVLTKEDIEQYQAHVTRPSSRVTAAF